ncbi:MAG: histidine kinase [Bacteroidales bacterium]|jgi:sensor histidine kinase YesM|nr:histidine kinase [Bacteroidales bacterium]
MKNERKNYLFIRIIFLLFKIFLWICIGFFYTGFSVLIPTKPSNIIQEIMVFLCLAIVLSVLVSYLYPIVFKKGKWLYVLIVALSILFCAGFEMFVFNENFKTSYYTFPNKEKIYLITFVYVIIRDFSIFIFFFWVEYFNRLLLFYYKKDIINQRELLLLKEKQEFEKNFSRKSLFPHFFFNILELLYTKKLTNKKNSELFNKLKFVLYFFLIDFEKDVVELDKEIAFYYNYVELEKLRHEKEIRVNINVLGNIENYMILPLLFEPIVGNAMKYTLQDGTGWVDILFNTTQFPFFKFECQNNYLPNQNNIVSSKNGLKILKQRLEFCYKNRYTLEITHDADLYGVRLIIKMK